MTLQIIAEIGVNHNGDEDMARALIDAAANAGADWAKFQTFKTENLATQSAPTARYQRAADGGDSQFDMLKRLELSFTAFHSLKAYSEQRGIAFLSTPFDLESLRFLTDELGVDTVKLGSGDLTNAPLLMAVARTGRSLILSTGMADIETVSRAIGVLAYGYLDPTGPPCVKAFAEASASDEGRAAITRSVTLLHCVSAYPAAIEDTNLGAMARLRERFGVRVGFSDHTVGTTAAVAAAALGATVIEKHLTLDRTLPGPDHAASLEPEDLARLVRTSRDAARAAAGDSKGVLPCEEEIRAVARKSLVARKAIAAGEPLTEENLTVKRPGTGIDAIDYYDWLGRPVSRAYQADELIDE